MTNHKWREAFGKLIALEEELEVRQATNKELANQLCRTQGDLKAGTAQALGLTKKLEKARQDLREVVNADFSKLI